MAIRIERIAFDGYLVSALVRDNETPFDWYERKTYYGYAKEEIKPLFKAHLTENNLRIVRGN
jgi:hypothetical protein